MKGYADKCNNAKNTDLDVGDKVLIKQPKQNKMSTPFKPEPFEITDKKGSMIRAQMQNTPLQEMSLSLKSCLLTYLYITRKNSLHPSLMQQKQLNQMRQSNHLKMHQKHHLEMHQLNHRQLYQFNYPHFADQQEQHECLIFQRLLLEHCSNQ